MVHSYCAEGNTQFLSQNIAERADAKGRPSIPGKALQNII